MPSLYKLDLSFNQLDGEVPTHGVFSNMTRFSLDGNLGLCGGVSEIHLPTCLQNSMGHSKGKLHLILKVTVPVSSTVLFFALMLVYITLRKKQKDQSTALEGFHLIDDSILKFLMLSWSKEQMVSTQIICLVEEGMDQCTSAVCNSKMQ